MIVTSDQVEDHNGGVVAEGGGQVDAPSSDGDVEHSAGDLRRQGFSDDDKLKFLF